MPASRHVVVRYVVLRGGRWYLKYKLRSWRAALARRLPPRRRMILVALGGASAVGVTMVAARRLGG
jgi:hypothetical protein